MDQYNLFELGIILLFGLAGGLLIYGRRGLLPDREARARGVFLAGGLLCGLVCWLRVDSPYSFRTYNADDFVCHYGFLGPKIAIVLLPPVVLLLAAVLLCWKTRRLAQTESRNEIYHGMRLLCAAVCVELFIVETYPLLRELLF